MKVSVLALRLLLLLALLGLMFVPAAPAQAATCTVTSSADSGTGSLREKLGDATCATIDFGGDYTIRLVSTLGITRSVTVDGTGRTIVISGDTHNDGTGDVRLFSVSSGVTFDLNHLTLTKGNAGAGYGGALHNSGGTVTVSDSIVSSNSTTRYGGAIYNYSGAVSLRDSTFSNNTAGWGGAISNHATLTVTGSTFYRNSAYVADAAGGYGYGGAIDNHATLTVTNSTFVENSAPAASNSLGYGGAIQHQSGTASIVNSTFSRNSARYGGGIRADDPLTIWNSIIASSTGGNCSFFYATITGANNLENDTTCRNSAPASFRYVYGPNIGLEAAGLADNGGPTQTIALVSSSPAIDAGNDSGSVCPATDQRGTVRPQGLQCDIGAYEYVSSDCFSLGSTDWNAASTWSCNRVPGETDTAFIRGHNVSLSGSATAKNLGVTSSGHVDLNGNVLTLLGDLIDNNTGVAAILDSQATPGKVSFGGAAQQRIYSTMAKADGVETIVAANVEAQQPIRAERPVRIAGDLTLTNSASVDMAGHTRSMSPYDMVDKELILEGDLVDDSSAGEAIASTGGKMRFEGVFLTGLSEQKIRSVSKSDETRIRAEVEAKRKVKLQKDTRLKENLKVVLGGVLDVYDKVASLEKDLIDESSADAEAITSGDPAKAGKVSFAGTAAQQIRSESKAQETKIGAPVEARQRVKTTKDARFKEHLSIESGGALDVYDKVATLEKDLIDSTGAGAEVVISTDAAKSGRVRFHGLSQQLIKPGLSKMDESKFGAKMEAKQGVKLEANVRFAEELAVGQGGSLDVFDKTATLEKDLLDDSSSEAQAIRTTAPSATAGKLIFSESSQHLIKAGTYKTDPSKIAVKVEARQKVQLLKDVRLQAEVNLTHALFNSQAIDGYFDVAGKQLALEKDLVADSYATSAVEDSLGLTSPGAVVFAGPATQRITSSANLPVMFGAKVAIGQIVTIDQNVTFGDDLIVNPGGALDVYDNLAILEKDLDDRGAAGEEAISSSDPAKAGKVRFDGQAEQRVKTGTGKADESKIGVEVEVTQNLKLEKDVRFKRNVKFWGAAQLDVVNKKAALEMDLFDDSSAEEVITSSDPGKAGEASFDGSADQQVHSEYGKTLETKIGAKFKVKKPVGQALKILKPVAVKGDLTLDELHRGRISLWERLSLRRHLIDDRPDGVEDDAIDRPPEVTSANAEVAFEDQDVTSSSDQEVKSTKGRTKPTTLPTTKVKKASGKALKILKPVAVKGDLRLDANHDGKISLKERLALHRDLVDNRPDGKTGDAIEESGDSDYEKAKAEVVFEDKDEASSRDQEVRSDNNRTEPTTLPNTRVKKASGKALKNLKPVAVKGDLTLDELHRGRISLWERLSLRRHLIDDRPDSVEDNAIERSSDNSNAELAFEDKDEATSQDQEVKSNKGREAPTNLPTTSVNKKSGKALKILKPVAIRGDLRLDTNHDGKISLKESLALRRHLVDNRPDAKKGDAVEESDEAGYDKAKAEVVFEDEASSVDEYQEVKSETGRSEPTTLPNTRVKKASGKILRTLSPVVIRGDLKLDADHDGKISLRERLSLHRNLVDNRPNEKPQDAVEKDRDDTQGKAEVIFEDEVGSAGEDQEIRSDNNRSEPTTLPNTRVKKASGKALKNLKPVAVKGDLTLDELHRGRISLWERLSLRRHLIDDRPDGVEDDAIDRPVEVTSANAEVAFEDQDVTSSSDQEVKSTKGRTKPTTLPTTKVKKASGKALKILKPVAITGDLRLDADHDGKISLKESLALRRNLVDNRPDTKKGDAVEQSTDAGTDPAKAEVVFEDKEGSAGEDQEVKSENNRSELTTLPNTRVKKALGKALKNLKPVVVKGDLKLDANHNGKISLKERLALHGDLIDDRPDTNEQDAIDQADGAVPENAEMHFKGEQEQQIRGTARNRATRIVARTVVDKPAPTTQMSANALVLARGTNLPHLRLGSLATTSVGQSMRMPAPSTVQVVRTYRPSWLTTWLTRMQTQIALTDGDQVLVSPGSVDVQVLAGDGVQVTVGTNVTVNMPVNTTTKIDEPTTGGVVVANIGQSGSVTVVNYGVTTTVEPGGSINALSTLEISGLTVQPSVVAMNQSVAATITLTGAMPTTHRLDIDWDASTAGGEEQLYPGQALTVTRSHAYTVPGVYSVRATLTESADKATSRDFNYVVVYDPTAGFVTGGGWINSPAGNCQLTEVCKSATGKASFGFVSKYKKGMTVPEGETQFEFTAGSLAFYSNSYDWLVVAGAKAQYKGTGTIAGQAGVYKFLLQAIDGDANKSDSFTVDRFRIKIWQEVVSGEQVAYDSAPGSAVDQVSSDITQIGGGSIVIHAK